MLNKITKLFFKAEQPKVQKTLPPPDIKRATNELNLRPQYPPYDNGVPMMSIEEMLDTQKELIGRIKIAFGLTESNFNELVMSTIKNYAAYVHLLPATKNENHNSGGGLFRLGLEVGFYALQTADGKIFSNKESAERRRNLHPRWMCAAFTAGLSSEIYRALTTMTVTTPDGETWPQYTVPLYTWAHSRNADRYYIHWSEDTSNTPITHSATSSVMYMIIDSQCSQYINDDNSQIIPYMNNSINGASKHGDGNFIGELVRNAKDYVIDFDMKSNPAFYGKLTLGSHLEPVITDIMRDLIKKEIWTINCKQARIWYTKEGCFIVWTAAFNEIVKELTERKNQGVPSSKDTLADMLTNSGIFEPQVNGRPYWDITIPNTPKIVETVKLADPKVLYLSEKDDILTGVSLLNPVVEEKPNTETKSDTSNTTTVIEKKADIEQDKPAAKSSPAKEQPAEKVEKSAESVKPNSQEKIAKPGVERTTIAEAKNDAKIIEAPIVKPEIVEPSIPTEPAASKPSILDKMPLETQNLLNAIKYDYNRSENEHPVWMSAKGIVISREEFESHGISTIKVLDALIDNNWIVRDESNNNRVLYKTERNGAKINAYVLRQDIALAIGFKE